MTRRSRTGIAALGALLLGAAIGDRVGLVNAQSQDDAERCRQKVERIAQFASGESTEPLRTVFTENEVNAYLKFTLREQIPVGVAEPQLSGLGAGRVAARAIIDLDAIRKEHRSTGWLDPMRYLSGRLPVSARGVLQASGGVARLEFESAQVSGIPVPQALLQEIVTYYTRSPENPGGVNLDAPFPLPARIREVHVGTGQATVVQ